MAFSRDKAIAYATKYWRRVCDDNLVYIGTGRGVVSIDEKRKKWNAPKEDGWEAFFVKDGQGAEQVVFKQIVNNVEVATNNKPIVTEADDLEDCTHFISRCLFHEGVPIHQTPNANTLIVSLMRASYTKVLAKQVHHEEGQKIIDSGLMKPGDVIGIYRDKTSTHHGMKNRYGHSMMYTGSANSLNNDPASLGIGETGGITCHSSCRYGGLTQRVMGDSDDMWYIGEEIGETYTLIHFTLDDPPLKAGPLYGWWKVEQGSATWYCFVALNGAAHAVRIAPRSKHQHPHNAVARAKLLPTDGGVTFVWWEAGGKIRIERWAIGMAGSPQTSVQLDSGLALATRMFPY
jgi:hypothetical protein